MLVIQDPTDDNSPFLLESLLDSFQSAEKVCGAFAFVSSAGVRLLTADGSFTQLARNHTIDWVVGLDAITDIRALETLQGVARKYPNFRVRAFLNPKEGSLFHPKFCWIKNNNGGLLITGSGNLTEGGLLRHWEAYSTLKLDRVGIETVESSWNNWTEKYNSCLLPLDNADVQRRASNNNVLSPEGDLPTLVAPGSIRSVIEGTVGIQSVPEHTTVLLAEIPKGGDRWNQVSFHLDDYQHFFDADPSTKRLMVFRHIKSDGTMDEYERSRPSVVVKSRNFRFELAAAKNKKYPASGRPIGVYVRIEPKTFFYHLAMPTDADYASVESILQKHAVLRNNKMRTLRISAAVLKQEWPNAPFWRLPTTF